MQGILDDRVYPIHLFLDREVRRIYLVCPFRLHERSVLAGFVPLIPFEYRLQYCLFSQGFVLRVSFQPASMSTNCSIRNEEYLHRSIGCPDCPRISPFQDIVTRLDDFLPLGNEKITHDRLFREHRSQIGYFRVPDPSFVIRPIDADVIIRIESDLNSTQFLFRDIEDIPATCRDIEAKRPIHRTGIEISVSEFGSEQFRSCPFSASRRSIDGDSGKCIHIIHRS